MTRNGQTDPKRSRAKKSETLEVRIPHETKQAFLTACREDGTTASEVVRDQVQSYLDARERPSHQEEKRTLVMNFPPNVRRYGPRVAVGGLAAIGLTALAVLPSAAAPDFKAQFARLDANGDGALSVDEFIGPKSADDGDKDDRKIVIESRSVVRSNDDAAKAAPPPISEMKKEAFTFILPDEIGAPKDGATEQHEFKFISRSEVRDSKDGDPEHDVQVQSFSVNDLRKDEFASIDANKDGKVTLDEYRARQTAMLTRGFEILDSNGDKSLSQDEYAKIVAPPMIKLDWKGGPDTPEPPKVDLPPMKGVSPEAIKAAFTRLDGNRDGKLSLQEYLPKG